MSGPHQEYFRAATKDVWTQQPGILLPPRAHAQWTPPQGLSSTLEYTWKSTTTNHFISVNQWTLGLNVCTPNQMWSPLPYTSQAPLCRICEIQSCLSQQGKGNGGLSYSPSLVPTQSLSMLTSSYAQTMLDEPYIQSQPFFLCTWIFFPDLTCLNPPQRWLHSLWDIFLGIGELSAGWL